MGCDKICQAKKKAKKAQQQAKNAKKKKPKASNIPGQTNASISSEVVTVGDVLGKAEKYLAMTPHEISSNLKSAANNSLIKANSQARDLITPINRAFGVYSAYIVGQKVYNILKPAVKLAVNLGGIIFNFANIGELLADIAFMILMHLVAAAPLLLQALKNIFYSIPLYTKNLTKTQVNNITTLVDTTKIDIENAFVDSVNTLKTYKAIAGDNNLDLTGYNVSNPPYTENDILTGYGLTEQELKDVFAQKFIDGLAKCKDWILDDMKKRVDKINVNSNEIEDFSSSDMEDKKILNDVKNALLNATKKVESLTNAGVLDKTFTSSGAFPSPLGTNLEDINPGELQDNELAIAAAEKMYNRFLKSITKANDLNTNNGLTPTVDVDNIFLTVLHEEVEKKKKLTIETKEDVEAVGLAKDIVNDNMKEFVNEIENVLDDISLKSDVVDDTDINSYENDINSQVNTEISNIISTETTNINNAVINDTNDMEILRDAIINNICSTINSATPITSVNMSDSIDNTITNFKDTLYSEVTQKINNGDISLDNTLVPNSINTNEVKKMMEIFLNQVKKALISQADEVIIEELLPCKSCKPSAQLLDELENYANQQLPKLLNRICSKATNAILNDDLDWTITDGASITEKKQQLIDSMTNGLNEPFGNLGIFERVMTSLFAEQEELIKNIKFSLEQSIREIE